MLPKVKWITRCPDSKEGGICHRGLNAGSYYITEDEEMYESNVETMENALGARVLWTGSSHALAIPEARGVQ